MFYWLKRIINKRKSNDILRRIESGTVKSNDEECVSEHFKYDELTKVNNVYYCYCSKIDTLYDNAIKVINHFTVDEESKNEILDGIKFLLNIFPQNFPLEKMRVTLKDSRAIQFDDTIQKRNLLATTSNFGVSYTFIVGTYGIGWIVRTYDRFGETNVYKHSKNYFGFNHDDYTIKNVYEFVNSLREAMGYAAIPFPNADINAVKPKASEKNHGTPEEECNKGKQYLYGRGEDIDEERAFSHFKYSAENDYGLGMYYLSCCYFDGKGVTKDIEKGKFWLSKACNKDVALAYYRLGDMLDFDEDKAQLSYDIAFDLFNKDLVKGNSETLYRIALCYLYGHGVEQDTQKSLEYLLEAVKANNDDACYQLALYYKGGNDKNFSESFKWYQKAADLGNVDALYDIGYCYESGTGVEKNLEKAFEYYMKGAQKKHAYSQYKVGMCFLHGIGTEKNTDNAFVFLTIAGKKGFEDAKMIARQLLI